MLLVRDGEHGKHNGKRKQESEHGEYESLRQKAKMVSCMEVLTKEYFDLYITKLTSDMSDIKGMLNRLEENLKTMKTTCDRVLSDSSVEILNVTPANEKTNCDRVLSDSSVEFLSVTPAKENIGSKGKNDSIDLKIKRYGMLLDTGDGMGRNKMLVKSNRYNPFAVADRNLVNWLDSWLTIESNKYILSKLFLLFFIIFIAIVI